MATRTRAVADVTAGAGLRVRAFAIPVWVWLAAIVVVSAAVRIALTGRIVAPWIMIDEIVYSELAKSFAAHGEFLVRDVPSNGYGFVYPILIAPAWRLFASVPEAYAAAKAINAVVMSLAAIPAYFLARRLVRPPLALVVAALTVLVPSMLYTGMLMTENAFYPFFLVVVLALVATLERPTPLRQIVLLALCGLAYGTRAQAVALIAAAVTAPLVLAAIDRRGLRRTIREYSTLYGILAGGAMLALIATVARGRSPLELLGAYRAATASDYSVGRVLRFLLYHVAELDLYLGVVPFAALLALWLAPRAATPAARAFAAASLAVCVWLVAEVAIFASQTHVDKIEERNMFYVAPLALTALVAFSADGVVTRRRRPVVAAAVVAGVLPFFIPYRHFITTSAIADTFALLPWWWVQDHFVTIDQVRWVVLAAAIAAAAAFVLVPPRFALLLPAFVAVYFVATTYLVENGRHGIHKAALGKLWSGIRVADPDWIDRTVGRDASVAVLWTGPAGQEATWMNEFFSRSVGPVYDLAPAPDPLPATRAKRRSDGLLVADGRIVLTPYVLADGSVEVAGAEVGSDPLIGLHLYRVNGPITLLTDVEGLYENDTWSGRRVTYERVKCGGGRLSVQLGSDASLFTTPQVVTARVGGRVVAGVRVPPTGQVRLVVPLRPVGGRCTVDFEVGRTAVPAQVVPGSKDRRPLGAHFLSFDLVR